MAKASDLQALKTQVTTVIWTVSSASHPLLYRILASPSESQEAEITAFTVQTWRWRHGMIKWPVQGPATVSSQGLNACLIPQAISSVQLTPSQSTQTLFPAGAAMPQLFACWLLIAHSCHKRPALCLKVGQILGAIHTPAPGGIGLSWTPAEAMCTFALAPSTMGPVSCPFPWRGTNKLHAQESRSQTLLLGNWNQYALLPPKKPYIQPFSLENFST